MDAATGKTPIAAEIAAQVVALTCTEPRHHATHCTGRAMAKAIGISLGSVQRIWRAHKLQPHRLRTLPSREDPRGQEYHKLLRWAGHPVFIGFVLTYVSAAVRVTIPTITLKMISRVCGVEPNDSIGRAMLCAFCSLLNVIMPAPSAEPTAKRTPNTDISP